MSPTKLRIKIDHDGRLKWMFCDLKRLKSIKCLKEQVKDKYDLNKFNLLLENAILPKREPIELLNNGDTVQILLLGDDFKDTKPVDKIKKTNQNGTVNGTKQTPVKKSENESNESTESSSSESSSSSSLSSKNDKNPEKKSDSSSDDDEVETFEKSFNHVDYDPKLPEKPKDQPVVPQVPQVSEVEFVPKRKRHRKNKNKNKLATDANASPIVPKPVDPPKFATQGKITKFSDDNDEEEPEIKKYAASSSSVSCEDILLNSVPDIPKRKVPSPIKAVVTPMNHENGNGGQTVVRYHF